MKLLILNYEYPPIGGGAGVITQKTAEGLANLGHDITVITTYYETSNSETSNAPASNSEAYNSETTNGVRLFRLHSRRRSIYQSNPLEMLSWMHAAKRFLKKHLKTEKYDLCIANFSLPGGEVAYSMKEMFNLPYVAVSHGHDIPWFFPEQMMWYHAACYQWIRKICMQSECNFVQSNEMLTNIKAFLGGTPAHNKLIYNGWDRGEFYPAPDKRNKRFTILYTGRLVLQKDPMTFLKAISILKDRIPDFKVHIVGDGKLRGKMEKYIAKNGLTQIVEFKNWLDKPQMAEEYQSCSLAVMPSLAEGMSIALLEALACGQYVIATKVSNNEILISEGVNGDFIPKGNPQVLADKIQTYYETKFSNGYLVPQSHFDALAPRFDWSAIVKQYEETLLAIIERCTIMGKVQR